MWNKTITIIACLATLMLSSCDGKPPGKVDLSVNTKKFTVEVADSPEEMRLGLMFRKRLGEYEGMIFVYDNYVQSAFWMKNTEIPLSIAFMDKNGKIVDIRDMAPFDETPVGPAQPYVYALEVNQGAFDRLQVKIGDTIPIPASIRR